MCVKVSRAAYQHRVTATLALMGLLGHSDGVVDLEFWPDYGAGPLWLGGRAVEPEDLELDPSLATRLRDWNARYEEWKIPLDGPGDEEWLAEGRQLLQDVRQVLGPAYELGANEDWWDD